MRTLTALLVLVPLSATALLSGCGGSAYAGITGAAGVGGSAAGAGGQSAGSQDSRDAASGPVSLPPSSPPSTGTDFGPEAPESSFLEDYRGALVFDGAAQWTSHRLPGYLRLGYSVRNDQVAVSMGVFLGVGSPALPLRGDSPWQHASFGISWLDLRYNLLDSSSSRPLVGLSLGTDLYPQTILRFSGLVGLGLPLSRSGHHWLGLSAEPSIGFTTFYGRGQSNTTFDLGVRLVFGREPSPSGQEREQAHRLLLDGAGGKPIAATTGYTKVGQPMVDYLQPGDETFHETNVQFPNCYVFVGRGTNDLDDASEIAPGWPGGMAVSLLDAAGKVVSGQAEEGTSDQPDPDKALKSAPGLAYYCPPESTKASQILVALRNKGKSPEWVAVTQFRRAFEKKGQDRFAGYWADMERTLGAFLGFGSNFTKYTAQPNFGGMAHLGRTLAPGQCDSMVSVGRPDTDLDALLFVEREMTPKGTTPAWELADSDTKYYTDAATRVCNGGSAPLNWHLLVLITGRPRGEPDSDVTTLPIEIAVFHQTVGPKDLVTFADAPLAMPPPQGVDGGIPDGGASAGAHSSVWVIPRFARDLDESSFVLSFAVSGPLEVKYSVLPGSGPWNGHVTFDLTRGPRNPQSTDKESKLESAVPEFTQTLSAEYLYSLTVRSVGLSRRDSFVLLVPPLKALSDAGAVVEAKSQ